MSNYITQGEEPMLDEKGAVQSLATDAEQRQRSDSVTSNDLARSHTGKKGIRFGFTVSFVFTLSLGMLQFGYVLSSLATLATSFSYSHGWYDGNTTDSSNFDPNTSFLKQRFQGSATTVTCIGAMISAFTAGNFIKYGKWRMIMLTNCVLIVASGMCLINNFAVILIGRFFWGLSAGAMNTFTPAFISEVSPNEYKGPFGTINQFMVTGGIMITGLLGLAIPNAPYFDDQSPDSFIVAGYFRVFFGLPIIISLIQMILLMSCFRYESPVTLNERKNFDELSRLMGKLFHHNEVSARIQVLKDAKAEADRANAKRGAGGVSMKATFFDPSIRQSAYVACVISALQQLSGINAIIFYANQVFADTNLGANEAVALIDTVNFLACFLSYPLLVTFGRRTIMMVTYLAMAVFLIIQGWATLATAKANDAGDTDKAATLNNVSLICCNLFVAFFEFGPGPITWLYMPEISNMNAISIATGINWALTLVMALATNAMVTAMSGWTFILFGIFSFLGFLFCMFIMKETKGLSQEESMKLYRNDVDVIEQFEKAQAKKQDDSD